MPSARLDCEAPASGSHGLPAWLVGIVAMAIVADGFLLTRFAQRRWSAHRLRQARESLASRFD